MPTINNEPLISIVTVVFNGAKTFDQTNQSYVKQIFIIMKIGN